MRAVGAAARHQLGMAVEQERGAFVLRHGGEFFGAVDLRALVGVGQAQQHGGDVAGVERGGERHRESGGVLDRRVTR